MPESNEYASIVQSFLNELHTEIANLSNEAEQIKVRPKVIDDAERQLLDMLYTYD